MPFRGVTLRPSHFLGFRGYRRVRVVRPLQLAWRLAGAS